jgi:hypothetical protein
MNPSRIFTVLAFTSLAACQKAPLIPADDSKVDSRLAKIEAQLYRVEEGLVRLTEAESKRAVKATEEVTAPIAGQKPASERVTVYIYGETVPKPGEHQVIPGGTVMMAVAAAGGPGSYSSRNVTVIRKEKPNIELEEQGEWNNFTVEEGDVIVVKASAF